MSQMQDDVADADADYRSCLDYIYIYIYIYNYQCIYAYTCIQLHIHVVLYNYISSYNNIASSENLHHGVFVSTQTPWRRVPLDAGVQGEYSPWCFRQHANTMVKSFLWTPGVRRNCSPWCFRQHENTMVTSFFGRWRPEKLFTMVFSC